MTKPNITKTIQQTLLTIVLITGGMWLENRYHLYNTISSLFWLLIIIIGLIDIYLIIKANNDKLNYRK